MNDKQMMERIEQLEVRLMHLEAATEELTRTLLAQEQTARQQADALKTLQSRLRELSEQGAGSPPDPPPPHY